MSLLSRRTPFSRMLLGCGAYFIAMAVYARVSGDVVILHRGGHPLRILRDSDPRQFIMVSRIYCMAAFLGCFLAFARLDPVEDAGSRLRAAIKARGYDRAPAPAWAYGFFVGFVGFILWLGWKMMYSG